MKYLFLLFSLTLSFALQGQSFLDPAFGIGGIVIMPEDVPMASNGWLKSLVIQSDHKILAAGHRGGMGIVARYKDYGSLDSSFATNGIFTTDYHSIINVTAIQPDGKILAEGSYQGALEDSALTIRLNTDGSLDNTFGTNGRVHTGFAHGRSVGYAIALQPDNKIVIARAAYSNFVGFARLLPNGVPDSSFCDSGRVMINGFAGVAYGLGIMPDGRIASGGGQYFGYKFMAIRLLTNGRPDTSFNHVGYAGVNAGYTDNLAHAMVMQADGKIIIAGSGWYGTQGDNFTAVRYDTNGHLDPTYGDTGVVNVDFYGDNDSPYGIALTTDGKLLMTGRAAQASVPVFVTTRINNNGIIDNTFGVGGRLTTNVGNYKDVGLAITQQPDGKVLVSGSSNQAAPNYSEMTLLRYTPYPDIISTVNTNNHFVGLYPNPASNKLQVSEPERVLSINAYDMLGRAIEIGYVPHSRAIQLPELRDGMYLFTVSFDDHTSLTQSIRILNTQ